MSCPQIAVADGLQIPELSRRLIRDEDVDGQKKQPKILFSTRRTSPIT